MSPKTAAQTIQITGWVLFVVSVVFAAGAWPPLSGPVVMFYDLVDWPFHGAAQALPQEARLFTAILGGAFASLCMMMILIVAPAVARGDDAVRRNAIIAILTWFVVDSTGSIASGVPGNAVLNIVFLAAFLAPLIMVKSRNAARAVQA